MDAEVAAATVDSSMLLSDGDEFDGRLEVGTGPFAVVGPPFAGREGVLDDAATVLDARRVQLDPGAAPGTVADALGDGPLVVDGCHHLYSRRVGGFEALDTVLDCVTTAEETVVTGWNSYAWAYLDAVRNVGTLFADTFEMRELSGNELAEFVGERVTTLPTFRNDELDDGLVERREVSVGFRGRRLPLPFPNGTAIRARLVGRGDAEQAVFEQLAADANGNPGVALALWDRTVSGDVVRPSHVDPPSIETGREGAFLLRLVLESERLDRDRLVDRPGGTDRLLGRLADLGMITLGSESVEIEPLGVPAAVDATETWRIL